jgi:hypothetical protein
MTETTTDVEAASKTELLPHPSAILMSLITAVMAPIFLGVSGGDIGRARMAATETVHAYGARDQADLIAVAQILAFGLAALGSLSLSMADDIAILMVLRLRGSAVACNRSAEQNRRALTGSQADNWLPPRHDPVTEPEIPSGPVENDPSPEPAAFLNAAAARLLAAESHARLQQPPGHIPVPSPVPAAARTPAEKRHQEMWAIAMAKEASEITAGLPKLPTAEREAAAMRAALLSSTAHDLTHGAPVPPPKLGILAGRSGPDVHGTYSPSRSPPA